MLRKVRRLPLGKFPDRQQESNNTGRQASVDLAHGDKNDVTTQYSKWLAKLVAPTATDTLILLNTFVNFIMRDVRARKDLSIVETDQRQREAGRYIYQRLREDSCRHSDIQRLSLRGLRSHSPSGNEDHHHRKRRGDLTEFRRLDREFYSPEDDKGK